MKFEYRTSNQNCEIIYDIIFDREYSIGEFVDEILEMDECKEGWVEVFSTQYMPSIHSFKLCCIFYKGNHIIKTKSDHETLKEENLMRSTIHEASALQSYNGVWYFHVILGSKRK